MRTTLANFLHESYQELQAMSFTPEAYLQWIGKYPTQLVVLTAQVCDYIALLNHGACD